MYMYIYARVHLQSVYVHKEGEEDGIVVVGARMRGGSCRALLVAI